MLPDELPYPHDERSSHGHQETGENKKKRHARVRRPILPQPCAAVLSARAGLTSEFGTGSGDPRLHGRTRAGRSRAGAIYALVKVPGARVRATLAAAWRPIGRDRSQAVCVNGDRKGSGD